MKINRKELLNVLTSVKPGLASEAIMEQTGSFIFMNGRVITYNDEMAVSCPFESDLEGAVPAKDFYDLVNKVNSEEIEITINNEELVMKGSRAKAGLRIDSKIVLPVEELGNPEEWTDLPENFCEAIRFCMFSVSRDGKKPILNCLYAHDNCIDSSDGYRITRFETKGEFYEGDKFLIPAQAAKNAISFQPSEYAFTEGWIHFRNEADVVFSCRHLEEVFPNVETYLKAEGDTIEFPRNLSEILDRASVMSDGEHINVLLKNNKLTISSKKDAGWFEEDCRAKCSSESVEFDIHPDHLKSIIKSTQEATVTKQTIVFFGEDFTHVISLKA